MPENIIEICAITLLAECNQIEVRYMKDDGVCHYRIYEEFIKDAFITDVENPAFGGVEGAAQSYLEQMGWN